MGSKNSAAAYLTATLFSYRHFALFFQLILPVAVMLLSCFALFPRTFFLCPALLLPITHIRLFQPFRWIRCINQKKPLFLVFMHHHAEHNDFAEGICKRRVSLPDCATDLRECALPIFCCSPCIFQDDSIRL